MPHRWTPLSAPDRVRSALTVRSDHNEQVDEPLAGQRVLACEHKPNRVRAWILDGRPLVKGVHRARVGKLVFFGSREGRGFAAGGRITVRRSLDSVCVAKGGVCRVERGLDLLSVVRRNAGATEHVGLTSLETVLHVLPRAWRARMDGGRIVC